MEHEFSGAEPFLVGIAPGYWAHVPTLIGDIQNTLQLENGINCFPARAAALSDGKKMMMIPVSKCVIVGYIIQTNIRADGCFTFVLDDGTGLVDCIQWSCNPEEDIFYLPSIFPNDHDTNTNSSFQLGDLVRVYGKIKCLASKPDGTIVREIDVTLIKSATDAEKDAEARHWLKCFQTADQEPQERNSLGYLDLLGPKIQAQIVAHRDLPAADSETSGRNGHAAWRVFGPTCRCKLPYMKQLLYCHCQAKVEPLLDPKFQFRDALLGILMEWQEENVKKLVFNYKQIKNHSDLIQLADQMAATTAPKDTFFVDRLFRSTFSALRQDGIVYLQDADSDLYLFITRDKVLEPHVRNELLMQKQQAEQEESRYKKPRKNYINYYNGGAKFLSKVHRERLLYVQRCLEK